MVSPELLRRYPFFAGFSIEQITTLAKLADEMTCEPEQHLFREGEQLDHFYIILEGTIAIVVELIEKDKPAIIAELTAKEREITISTISRGEVFAWSALIPPYQATASARPMTACRVIAFDCRKLRDRFEADSQFGYLMMQRAAQGMRDRLHSMRIEALAYAADNEQ